jgi:hypothetical protein
MAAGYSADVQLFLIVDGRTYALAQIGPDFVTLREPAELPTADAEVVMVVDGRENRWAVTLEPRKLQSALDVATADR